MVEMAGAVKQMLWKRVGGALMGSWLALAAVPALPAAAGGPLAGRTIVVDPGHGGSDGGATAWGRDEKNITLPIGLDLGAALRWGGANVVYTRSSDVYVSLAERTAIANAAGAAAFVSIHVNALNDPAYRGLTTYYGGANGFVTGVRRSAAEVAASRALALDVQAATQAQTGEINRGVQPANYYVLGLPTMPSILVETGFLTNPQEGAQLATPAVQERLAAGIADGLSRFFSGQTAATTSASTASSSAGYAGQNRYVIRSGDTLSGLAVRFGLSESSLLAANRLPSADRLFAGQTIVIPQHAAVTPQVSPQVAAVVTAGMGRSAHAGYTVQSGDTLSALALRFGVSERAIAQANDLGNLDMVQAGQSLAIPSGGTAAVAGPGNGAATPTSRRYRIRPGDTLSGIAVRLGITEQALARANNLSSLDRLYAGRYLALPTGTA